MILSKIPTHLKQLISSEIAHHYQIIPFDLTDNQLKVYTPEKDRSQTSVETLNIITGYQITVELVKDTDFEELLISTYPKTNVENDIIFANDQFLDKIIYQATKIKSSDIHIEAFEGQGRIRYRIDGLLVEQFIIPKEEYPTLVNQIKIAAQLDISEKRLPQDGRIHVEQPSYKFDIRISIIPTLHGEKIVMRLLSKENIKIELDSLGFDTEELQTFMQYIRKKHGIILVSGPTGSGKTTTLYGALKELNKETNNILTVEDPIEYTIPGINQVQLKENIGLDFSKVLKSFLRQDPDIIMVGEIRDTDTADIAIRAALTGHLVLSTIHTNSAWATISRLIDMGIPEYLIADTLIMSVAQRLLRKLCPHCKKEISYDELQNLQPYIKKTSILYKAVGCRHCFHTGYTGRVAIYEIIPIESVLMEHIKNQHQNYPRDLLKNYATIPDKALDLLKKGITSFEEVQALLSTTA
ncbi:GspE/PulE family protein [Wenyingzhuangia sp. IMCC45533]